MAAREGLHWDTNSDLKVTPVGQPRLVRTAEPVEANHGSMFLSNLDQSLCPYATEIFYLFKARAGAPGGMPGQFPNNSPWPSSAQGIRTGGAPSSSSCPTESKGAALPGKAADREDDPAALLRDALARALVLFYPFTGRLRITPQGRYEVNLTGEGVLFVEAEANLELAQLGYGAGVVPPCAVAKQLVIQYPCDPVPGPLMAAQVTRFRCGGWALGTTMNHGLVDGASGLRFMQVWAKLAKLGSTKSCTHDRDFIPLSLDRTRLRQRSPLQVGFDHAACFGTGAAEARTAAEPSQEFAFRLKGEALQVLKQRILQEQVCLEGKARGATTFEALGALLWRARTRAVGMAGEEQTEMRIWVNVSNKLHPPLPQGYMGNAIAKGVPPRKGDLSRKPIL